MRYHCGIVDRIVFLFVFAILFGIGGGLVLLAPWKTKRLAQGVRRASLAPMLRRGRLAPEQANNHQIEDLFLKR